MSQPATTDALEQAAANQRNLRRLVLSVQASLHKLNLLIAVCDNPRYRDELIGTYEAELTANGIICDQVRLDRQQPSLKQSLVDWQAHLDDRPSNPPIMVTIRGGDELLGVRLQEPKSAQERFFFSVQWTREGLRDFEVPIVLWVTQSISQGLAQQAPDFWSWRGGVFEFVQPIAASFVSPKQDLESAPNIRSTDGSTLTNQSAPVAEPDALVQQIADLQTEDPNSPLLESLYESLGEAYYQRLKRGIAVDRPQEEANAIAAFKSAIAHRETLADLTLLATSLSYLANLYRSQGRYSDAEPLHLKALHIYQRQLGDDHPSVASSLNNLAGLYNSQGRYSDAEPLLLQALDIRQRQLGDDHPDVASSLNNLAELYRSQGRYSDAEPLFLKALDIRQRQLGDDHPSVGTSLNNLASLYASQGRYSDAEPLYLQALNICRRQLGDDHPDVATSLNNLALLYTSQGRYNEAEPLLLRSLEINQKTHTENHPSIQRAWENFRYLVRKTVEAGKTNQLSDHPTTQMILRSLETEDTNA